MRFHKSLFLILLNSVLFSAYGQMRVPSDSLSILPKKEWRAAGMIFGTNVGVWAFDRYVVKGPYADINLNTCQKNINTGFVWDNDMFLTNLFAHPYHGGLYFNAARCNGLNYWQSAPYTAAGSLMWEFCMENEPAAINDFLATTIGGMCLGEMTFRISDMLIDNRSTGFGRFKREALLTIISPIRGLNRLINGETWRHSITRGNAIPGTPISFYSAIGHRSITDNVDKKLDFSKMICYDLGLNYGDPYNEENEKPYDFFLLSIGGNLSYQQPVISRVNALGMLFLKTIALKRSDRQLAVGIFQHFNYYQSQGDTNHVTLNPYKISEAASVGPGLLFKARLKNHFTFSASTYLSAILLGGSQTDHFKYDKRDYNMGSGFSSKLNLDLLFDDKINIRMNSEDYRLYTWVGFDPKDTEKFSSNVQGDVGKASLSVAKLSFSYILNKHLTFGTETSFFYRKNSYKYYPDVEHSIRENKFSVGYIF